MYTTLKLLTVTMSSALDFRPVISGVTSGLDIGAIGLLHVQFEHCINKNSVLIALHVTNNLQCIQLCETTCKKISTSASLPWALQA
ncbi:hypothetical protein AKL15_01465 [Corynebacterium glutamicum]|nr:hypothetical protein AUO96_07105 [Corynebacterium glutamicum]QDX74516.1 hypothetical protein AKL15_01465 [Corynebacterium glutamicum]QDX77276.1 hypothetical protein AKL16_01470 [Corynebacterium glutamicum]TWS34592.1 hypothetical protein AKJ19_08875 [Corynebacterium glutamicum]TWS38151.1 hypothetical protein AKJ20_00875 [Corynebacterium glutamicum]